MFAGTPEELRAREQQAAVLARKVAELLNRIEALGIGQAGGSIAGPGFRIMHGRDGWETRT